MKCVFSSDFKDLVVTSVEVVIALTLMCIALLGIFFLIGYTTFQFLDWAILKSIAYSPTEYYIGQGVLLTALTLLSLIILSLIYTLIIYPLYFLIFKFKKVINYIFDCKGN